MERYTNLIIDNSVRLKEEENHLIWSLNPTGAYIPKIDYKALAKEGREDQQIWWCKIIWKLKCLTKSKILCV